jgi:mxaA protein
MPNTTEELKKAVARLHTALNNTAGSILFSNNLDDFLQRKPAYTPLKQEIEKFFMLSSQVFFEPTTASHIGESPKVWLQIFCRHLRDCERGLIPNIKSKASH